VAVGQTVHYNGVFSLHQAAIVLGRGDASRLHLLIIDEDGVMFSLKDVPAGRENARLSWHPVHL
jgi:hypothetical protein